MSALKEREKASTQLEEEQEDAEHALKREALQFAAMMPRDKKRARKILKMTLELVDNYL